MKRIKVPLLQRLRLAQNGSVYKDEDGPFVRWIEVKMLLSILAGNGIIEVVDSDFEVSDVEIVNEPDLEITDDKGRTSSSSGYIA